MEPSTGLPGCWLPSRVPARPRLGSFALTIGGRDIRRPPLSGLGPGHRCIPVVRGSPVATVNQGCGGGCMPPRLYF